MSQPSLQDLLHQAIEAERLGRFDDARALLREAAARGDEALTRDARLRLGRLLIHGGPPFYGEAEEVLSAARRQAEAEASPRALAVAIQLLALLARHRGRYDDAIALLDASPANHLADEPGWEVGQLHHYRGLIAADRHLLDRSEALYVQAFRTYQALRYTPGLAETTDSLANLMLKRGKTHRALAFARQSLDLKRALGDRFGEAISLGTLGRAFVLQLRYSEAEGAFERSLSLAVDLNDQRGVGIMLNSLGDVARLRNGLDAAAERFRSSLAVDRGPFNAMHAYLGMARVHLAAQQLDEAEAAADRMAETLAANPPIHGLPDALVGLRGAIAWRQGNAVEGERLLGEAIGALQRRGQDIDAIPFLYDLRDLYQAQGRLSEAVATMGQALDLLNAAGAEQGVLEAENWLRTVDPTALNRLVLGQHFPDYVVDSIVAGRLGRPPTSVQPITVLFSDIRDFTTMSEGLAADEIVELLNEWFGEAAQAIRNHGGVLDKFMGDGLMALFGLPQPRESAPADAVRAALAMRDGLATLNQRRAVLGGSEIRIGIGVHSGDAVVGFIGSHLRQSYTAIGDTVNTASRLEAATKLHPGCDILISQATEEGQTRYGVAETEFIGYEALKGKSERIAAYQVRGRLAAVH